MQSRKLKRVHEKLVQSSAYGWHCIIMRKKRLVLLVACCVTLLTLYNKITDQSLDIHINNAQWIPSLKPYRSVPKPTQQKKFHIHAAQYYAGKKKLVTGFDCEKVIEGDSNEIQKAKRVPGGSGVSSPDKSFINITRDCNEFKENRGYNQYTTSKEEEDFPISYSILLYKDVAQAERLLRAIYRPHNAYCIHVDQSADPVVHQAMKGITDCFENVFIVSKTVDIIYKGMSRLKAELNCLKDLMTNSIKWKYFINLPSQEYPLKTNRELVKILRVYNGANDIEGISEPHRMMKARYTYKYILIGKTMKRTSNLKRSPPHDIKIVKGSAYGVFSRAFVNFTLNDQRAIDLLQWMEDILSPDEYYWATLNHDKSLKAPGGYTGVPDKKPWLAAYASWGGRDRCYDHKFVRGICIFGLGDLTQLVAKKELFANKFFTDYQPQALDCLEEWFINKTFNPHPLELFYYRNLPFVKSN